MAEKRYAPPRVSASHPPPAPKQISNAESSPLDRGWRLSILHQHAGKSGGRSSVSAGHAQRARMISNHLDGYEQTLPRMFITRTGASVCQLVQLLSQADRSPNGMTQSLYPGRPRGGLTFVPSHHPHQDGISAVSLFVLGGLWSHLLCPLTEVSTPSPQQVSRQGPVDQQS